MRHKILFTTVAIFVALSIRLFCGVYIHDEFADKHLFLKHRPIWKWKFYSPIGMSDLKIEELSKEERIEQKYFDEFVNEKGLSL